MSKKLITDQLVYMKSRISDETRFKQGRGKGEGKNWNPWIHGRDFPGISSAFKIPSFKFPGRHVEIMSGIEEDLFYIVDVSENVVDYFEQYPLLPLGKTISIAKRLQIVHIPLTSEKKEILTTDMVVKLRKGGLVAFCVKASSDLNDPRVIEKIQIEKTYWEERGVKWILVTERNIDDVVRHNIRFLRERLFLDSNLKPTFLKALKGEPRKSNMRMDELIKKCAKELKLTYGSAIELFYELVARRMIKFNFRKALSIELPVNDFDF